MPDIVLTTPYAWVVYDLKEIAAELHKLQILSKDNISSVEATQAQYYLKQVLEALILATRIGKREWPSLPQQMQSLITSASLTETST